MRQEAFGFGAGRPTAKRVSKETLSHPPGVALPEFDDRWRLDAAGLHHEQLVTPE